MHPVNLELEPCKVCSDFPYYDLRTGDLMEEYFAIVCPNCGQTVRGITSECVKDLWNKLNRKGG